jgi:hypothetical protein
MGKEEEKGEKKDKKNKKKLILVNYRVSYSQYFPSFIFSGSLSLRMLHSTCLTSTTIKE